MNSEDHCTRYEYDLLKRQTKKHVSGMHLHETAYDNMHHIVQESVGDDPTQLAPQISTQTTAKI